MKGKRLWVLCAVSLGLTLFITIVSKIMIVSGFTKITTINFYTDFLDMFIDVVPIYMMIFAVGLVADEYSSKYCNNLFSITNQKYKFVTANFVALIAFLALMFVTTFVPTLILELILHGSNLKFVGFGHFLTVLGSNMILILAIGVVCMFLATLMRNSVPLTLGIVYMLFFSGMIYMALDFLLYKLNIEFAFRKYLLFGNLIEISQKCNEMVLLRCIIVSVIYIAVFAVANTAILQKRDL